MATSSSRLFLTAFAVFLSCVYTPTQAANTGDLVIINDATKTGAVCLDGSPPGYYYKAGSGKGANSWIVFMEGGGFCGTQEDCFKRSKSALGSSLHWEKTLELDGFLSGDNATNPDFYNWNVARINYCDGGTYGGDVSDPIDVNGTMLYLRGLRVLKATIKYLLSQGMNSADRVILSGCSAGGISTYLHADLVGSLLPKSMPYHAMADAGYFINAANIHGEYAFKANVISAITLHNGTGGVIEQCASKYSTEIWKCAMAQYIYEFIQTPFFTVNSAWDTWQLQNILQLNCYPWECPSAEEKQFQNYGHEFMAAIEPIKQSATNGMFIDSCLQHCHSQRMTSWSDIKVSGKSPLQAFGDWYFGREKEVKLQDCDYPCNPTCPKRV